MTCLVWTIHTGGGGGGGTNWLSQTRRHLPRPLVISQSGAVRGLGTEGCGMTRGVADFRVLGSVTGMEKGSRNGVARGAMGSERVRGAQRTVTWKGACSFHRDGRRIPGVHFRSLRTAERGCESDGPRLRPRLQQPRRPVSSDYCTSSVGPFPAARCPPRCTSTQSLRNRIPTCAGRSLPPTEEDLLQNKTDSF